MNALQMFKEVREKRARKQRNMAVHPVTIMDSDQGAKGTLEEF